MFSKFFIDRPIFATVLALLIIVAGLVTLGILPIAQYPDITPPTVQVSAVYPGANAQTVAQTVGIPIEQQVNGVDGMLLYISSNSSSSGAYSLTVTFAVGTDIDMATVQVQNRHPARHNHLRLLRNGGLRYESDQQYRYVSDRHEVPTTKFESLLRRLAPS